MTTPSLAEQLDAARLEQMETDCEAVCPFCAEARRQQKLEEQHKRQSRKPLKLKVPRVGPAYQSWGTARTYQSQRASLQDDPYWWWGQWVHRVTTTKGTKAKVHNEECKAALIRFQSDPRHMIAQDAVPAAESNPDDGFEQVSARMAL